MARRAQIVIDAKDLDVYDQLINEIKAKGGKHGQTDPVRTVQIDPFKTA